MHTATKSSKIDITLEKSTEFISKKFSNYIRKGDIIFFYGEIGVGKTTFIKYLINRLQYKKELNITERPRLEHAGRDIHWSYDEKYLDTDRLKFKNNHIDRITFNTPSTHKGSIDKYVKLFSSSRNHTSSI